MRIKPIALRGFRQEPSCQLFADAVRALQQQVDGVAQRLEFRSIHGPPPFTAARSGARHRDSALPAQHAVSRISISRRIIRCATRRNPATDRQGLHPLALRNRRARLRRCGGKRTTPVASVRLREALDLVVRAPGRTIANADQAEHPECTVDHPPLLDDANEKIPCEQRRGCALCRDQGQEHLEPARPSRSAAKASRFGRDLTTDQKAMGTRKSARTKFSVKPT